MEREVSQFAPEFDGYNFQYKYLEEIAAVLLENDLEIFGPGEPEVDETYMDFMGRMSLHVQYIDEMQAYMSPEAFSQIEAILAEAPFYTSNCYGYSVDSDHDMVPNPGDKGMDIAFDAIGNEVTLGMNRYDITQNYSDAFNEAVEDGLVPADLDENGNPIPINGEGMEDSYYLVAFYTRDGEDGDYHWVMENSQGWSHQMGAMGLVEHFPDLEYPHQGLPAVEEKGYNFHSYFYVPANRIDVGLDANPEFMKYAGIILTGEPNDITFNYEPLENSTVPLALPEF